MDRGHRLRLIFGERHLRAVPAQNQCTTTTGDRTAAANYARPGHAIADLSAQWIKRRPVLGGLINEYERVA